MAEKNRNTWKAKVRRTITSVLPVSKEREGNCINCGECCKLPNICPFLKYKENKESYCSIHKVRPFNCRKYPRTKKEWITSGTCGFRFK